MVVFEIPVDLKLICLCKMWVPYTYIYIYVEGTFMYRMTALEISIYHSRIMIYDGR